MRKFKAVVGAALIVGVVTALPASASADSGAKKGSHKGAHAAGGDVPPVLPSAVRVRLKRGENALDKVGEYVDKGAPDKAINSLRGARANMYAAWRAAKYGIENAPAPPPDDAKTTAHASQDDGPVGTIYADQNTTAVAVLNYQHDVVAASVGLIDDAKGTLENALSTTMFAALDRRDAAIAYIRTLAPPVDPEAKTLAHTSQDEEGVVPVDFALLMPTLTVDLDDELAQSNELIEDGALTAAEKRIVRLAKVQITDTEATINAAWPVDPEA
jgi:hypothetical protein